MRYLLIKIDPERNMKRFYLICVQPTLWGEHCVVRIHGRIGQSERILSPWVYESAEAAQHAAKKLAERKKKRGYVDTQESVFESGLAGVVAVPTGEAKGDSVT